MIYFDNAATTKTYDECIEVLQKYLCEEYYNPSALYKNATNVAMDLESARKHFMKTLHAPDGKLVFLGSGSEADNMVLWGTKKWNGSKIIVPVGEHDAIYNTALELKNQGVDVEFVPIKKDGSVDLQKLDEMLDRSVCLVSIMHVSNETGAINDLQKISKMIKAKSPRAVFHSDGVQAYGKLEINLRALGVDCYTISGHKIHAPKGVGALFVKKGTHIKPLIYGGGQESGYRASTENVAGIKAFECASKRIYKALIETNKNLSDTVEYLKNGLLQKCANVQIITPEKSTAGILTVAFENIRGEVLLHVLEKYGIMVGIGSACSSHHESRFKKLLELDESHKDGIIRFSLSEFNNKEEVDFVLEKLKIALAEWAKFVRK